MSHALQGLLGKLIKVHTVIRNASLKVKATTHNFVQTNVKFLKFKIAGGLLEGRRPWVKEWPIPKNLTELTRFLRMTSYYQFSISPFIDIAKPSHKLLQRDVKFEWNKGCHDAFESLKERLISSPILGFPNIAKDYVLHADTSGASIGAVLTHKGDSDTEKIILFESKTTLRSKLDYDGVGSIHRCLGLTVFQPIHLWQTCYRFTECNETLDENLKK